MDGVALVLEAEAAGLALRLEGDRLVIRGPRSAERTARMLLDNKPAVAAALHAKTTAAAPKPQATDEARAQYTACSPTAMADETKGRPAGTVGGHNSIPGIAQAAGGHNSDLGTFEGWILRPDVSRRLHWESPDLPEAARWWARVTFDELPEIPPLRRSCRLGIDPCEWCGQLDWWRSIPWPDVVRCGNCHPPASGLPVEWLNRSAKHDAKNQTSIGGSRERFGKENQLLLAYPARAVVVECSWSDLRRAADGVRK